METRGSRGVAAWCAVEEEIRQVALIYFHRPADAGCNVTSTWRRVSSCPHFGLFVSIITAHIIAATWSALDREP